MLRNLSQGLFLAAFTVLLVTGKIQLWMGLFVLGVGVSLLWGRFYCGWACPMHTVMRGIAWVKAKLHIKSLRAPAFIKHPVTRYAVMTLFIGAFTFVMVTGRQIPVLLILLGLSVLVTAMFNESMWHRYLCPQGAILSITGRAGKKGLQVGPECVGCGVCATACPARAIVSRERYMIITHECIRCGKCETACPAEAIMKGREVS